MKSAECEKIGGGWRVLLRSVEKWGSLCDAGRRKSKQNKTKALAVMVGNETEWPLVDLHFWPQTLPYNVTTHLYIMNQCTVAVFFFPASSHAVADILAPSASIFFVHLLFRAGASGAHVQAGVWKAGGSHKWGANWLWLVQSGLGVFFLPPPLPPSSCSSFTTRTPQFYQDGEVSRAATEGLSDLSSLLNAYSFKAHCAESHCRQEWEDSVSVSLSAEGKKKYMYNLQGPILKAIPVLHGNNFNSF